jgi:beta-mannosidase
MVDIAASAVTSQAENATGGNRFLHTGWKCAATLPGRYAEPAGLEGAALEWIDATVPGTVASCRGHDLDTPADFDAHDWWYVVDFSAEPASAGARDTLRFDGLATLAEVWLNGKRILSSRNMFVGHRVDVNALLARENRLAILFRSLDAALAEKRPRPRWKTALVSHQNLRWFRTTLLGRIPGWTPRANAPSTSISPSWCFGRVRIAALRRSMSTRTCRRFRRARSSLRVFA